MGNTSSTTAKQPEVNSLNEKAVFIESMASMAVSPESPKPHAANGSMSPSALSSWEETLSADKTHTLARTILQHSNIRDALQSRQAHTEDVHVFNTRIELGSKEKGIEFKAGPVTNQKSSGRCWLFATTNVLRYEVVRKLNVQDFQFSQNYLFFYDKLNKANYYLELSIEHADLELDERIVEHTADDLLSDGGQWDMAVNLLETYGAIPQALFPESFHSSLSSPLNSLLKTKLREHALILRKLAKELKVQGALSAAQQMNTLRAKKESLMKEIYTIMTATLGVPPTPDSVLRWDYYDKDGKPGHWEGTPKTFLKEFGGKYAPSNSFSLINDPRNAYQKLYTVDKLGNVWGGRPVLYVNTEIDNLKAAVIKSIKAGQPVFFGCDVGKYSDTPSGIMDVALYEDSYQQAFGVTLGLTKAERLQVGESSMTHAMVISAVHLDTDGKPVRYRVENSWGEGAGDKGYMIMSDKWFEQFVYQVVVPRALAAKELVKVLDGGNAVVLPLWDPMGALA